YQAAIAAPSEGATPWAPLAMVKSLLASAYRCDGGGSLTLIATVGNDSELADRIAGLSNAELHVARGAGGRVELDPVASRSEYIDGFVPEDQRQALSAARAQLAKAARPDAIHRAAENAANTKSSAELRALLSS
ncbi:MAG: hypothetical protein KJO07_21515, partial [Deltaproteobacteria bacterium]|nr:hypothetical protein [Deltaproteobacteria bacterium]